MVNLDDEATGTLSWRKLTYRF